MAQDKAKWITTQKGFGFIQPDNDGADTFVHFTALEHAGLRALNQSQKISYEIVTERGRLSATYLQASWFAARLHQ